MKLKMIIEDLEKLKERYDDLRLLIADQVRDNQIIEAKKNFENLQSLEMAIEQIEKLDIDLFQGRETTG